jgi:hypothetical protein
VASSISETRQRQILALLLSAFAVLALASLATYEPPLPGARSWSAANACGPVGAFMSYALVWAFGRVAAFGVPLVSAVWAWNRFRSRPAGPLALSSLIGALLMFELCTLFGLVSLSRWMWAGGWGFAAALALHSALGQVGSWIVAGALFGITALAASELGFHWIARLLHGAVMTPANGAVGLWSAWRERSARSAPATKKPRVVRAPAAADLSPAAAEAKPRASRDGTAQQIRMPLPGPVKADQKPKLKSRIEPQGVPGETPTEAFPSLSLLQMPDQPEDVVSASDLTSDANLLVAKLADFGIIRRVTRSSRTCRRTYEFEWRQASSQPDRVAGRSALAQGAAHPHCARPRKRRRGCRDSNRRRRTCISARCFPPRRTSPVTRH